MNLKKRKKKFRIYNLFFFDDFFAAFFFAIKSTSYLFLEDRKI